MPFYTLKPINYAWTYYFMIFTLMLLKFCDVVNYDTQHKLSLSC